METDKISYIKCSGKELITSGINMRIFPEFIAENLERENNPYGIICYFGNSSGKPIEIYSINSKEKFTFQHFPNRKVEDCPLDEEKILKIPILERIDGADHALLRLLKHIGFYLTTGLLIYGKSFTFFHEGDWYLIERIS